MVRLTIVVLCVIATGIYADYAPTARNPPEPKPKSQNNYVQPAQNQYGQPAQNQYGQPAQNQYGQPAQNQYGQPAQNQYGQPAQNQYGQPAQNQYAQPAQNQYAQPAQNQYAQPAQNQYAQPAQNQYAPAPAGYGQPVPAPTKGYYTTPKPTAPPPFVAPSVAYPQAKYTCSATCKPNSAKYMAYVCSSLYAKAVEWSNNKCKPYYDVASVYTTGSEYQARLCTYWTQKSVLAVVSSCFMEAHLRNEFIMKYGKDGPGVWYCRYSDFVNQVRDCYSNSLKFYPLGKDMNALESEVAALYTPDNDKMPPFEFRDASVAMCAYYNKDQVYNPVKYS